MSIFILEDDIVQAQNMRGLIEQLCEAHQIPYDFIETTSKTSEILSKIAHCSFIPIYFLDIEIKQEERKGLDVAKEIREMDGQGIIVFVTTHAELAPISYQYMVSALTFIDKNAPFAERKHCIESCLQHYASKNNRMQVNDYLVVENAYTTIKVPFQTVEYVMTDEPHRLQLITTNQLLQFYGTLKEIEEMDERLIRCHKSYVVNESQMQAIDTKQHHIVLKSGKTIPVSRRMIKTIKALLKEG